MLTLDVLRGDESGIDEMSVDTYAWQWMALLMRIAE